MKPASDFAFSPAQRGVILAASLLVPTAQREEWRSEWLAELWHVRHMLAGIDETYSWEAQREIASFCFGAFPDALCLRTQSSPTSAAPAHVPPAHIHGSAGHTLLWLFAAVAICCIISRFLPGVNAENEASRFTIKSNVLLINEAGDGLAHPAISTKLIRSWQMTRQRFFEDLAYYTVSHESTQTGSGAAQWKVAHSTRNLFALLGVPILLVAPSDDSAPALPRAVLSHNAWMRNFSGNPRIAGHILRIGSRKVMIAGVAPASGWLPPGRPDLWLLESQDQLAPELSSAREGYLFGKLSERGEAAWSGPGIAISARDLQDVAIDLYGAPIEAPVEGPWGIYKFALFLALLALPAVTSVSLGESNVSSHRPSAKQQTYRVLFLAAKFILVAALGLYASLDVAYFAFTGFAPMAECLQLFACFAICLAGFRWAIADQRQRCPVCLRRVTNPATVGLASRTFLGWNGTELICMGGHALLHVPSLPTSWFGGQRWLYLDSSWDFLFGDSYVF
jgi:hypothetical protein